MGKIQSEVISPELQKAWCECAFHVLRSLDIDHDAFAENCGMVSWDHFKKFYFFEAKNGKRLPKLYFLGTMQGFHHMIWEWNFGENDPYYDDPALKRHRLNTILNECWTKYKEETKLNTTKII